MSEFYFVIDKSTPNWKYNLRLRGADCIVKSELGCDVADFSTYFMASNGGESFAKEIARVLNEGMNNE